MPGGPLEPSGQAFVPLLAQQSLQPSSQSSRQQSSRPGGYGEALGGHRLGARDPFADLAPDDPLMLLQAAETSFDGADVLGTSDGDVLASYHSYHSDGDVLGDSGDVLPSPAADEVTKLSGRPMHACAHHGALSPQVTKLSGQAASLSEQLELTKLKSDQTSQALEGTQKQLKMARTARETALTSERHWKSQLMEAQGRADALQEATGAAMNETDAASVRYGETTSTILCMHVLTTAPSPNRYVTAKPPPRSSACTCSPRRPLPTGTFGRSQLHDPSSQRVARRRGSSRTAGCREGTAERGGPEAARQ